MNPELTSLVWVSTFTALLWIPYVLNRMMVVGIGGTVGYPVDPPPEGGSFECRRESGRVRRTDRGGPIPRR